MAFVRRKGNLFYLVHSVRRGDKVRQLHLARLGDRARITDEVVREVSKKHPFVELNWRALREQLSTRVDLTNPSAPAVQKLVFSLRALNLDLAEIFPPLLRISEPPAGSRERLVRWRSLPGIIQRDCDHLGGGRGRFSSANPPSRAR